MRLNAQRGSASALLLAVGAAAFVRAGAVFVRHRAETAADLAALAGATAIGRTADDAAVCGAARAVALANHAVLVACAASVAGDGRSGEVTVRVQALGQLPAWGQVQVTATARAGRSPP